MFFSFPGYFEQRQLSPKTLFYGKIHASSSHTVFGDCSCRITRRLMGEDVPLEPVVIVKASVVEP